MIKKILASVLVSATILVSGLGALTTAYAKESREQNGNVITATNAASGNALLVFDKNLLLQATVPTGGAGTGSGLGNQGGITVAGNTLLVVNAGDNTISSFRIEDGDLHLANVVSSHGIKPVSVTVWKNIVYVVNAGDATIAGFTLDEESNLSFLGGSVRSLAGTAPAQIGFALGGRELVVTEKGTNTIEVFPLDADSLALASVVTPSSGMTPFGFEVKGHNLIVSEAFGGTASALSTYRLHADGTLTLISPSVVATGQKAACWVVTSKDGRFAFTTNTASNAVSSFRLRGNGTLELAQATAATTDKGPVDMAVSDKTLFVLTSLGLTPFTIGNDGTLGAVSSSASAPGANGLAVINE